MAIDPALTIASLTPLLGDWRGAGDGLHPTITSFRYTEQLRFEADRERALLHYEQRARRCLNGTSTWNESHWESGFLRALEDGTIEMTNAQEGGRLEIMKFHLETLPSGLVLAGVSTGLFNDARMIRTERRYQLQDGVLRYEVHMATTNVPGGSLHLRAELRRAP